MRWARRARRQHRAAHRRRHRDRGVALVEAALVLPVVVLFVMGIIEFGLYFSTTATTTSVTREGARTAASEFAPLAEKDVAADVIRRAVERALEGNTGYAEPVRLLVYRADPNGRPVDGFDACEEDCWQFAWTGSRFEVVGGDGWHDPDACIGDGDDLDSIGVFLEVRHHQVTGMFGDTRTVTHKTAMRLEPLPLAQCT